MTKFRSVLTLFALALTGTSSWSYGEGVNIQPANTAIDTVEMIRIGGIDQVISIKGDDSANPILLYLHGGPGQSVMKIADKLTGNLQKDFVVVHWDQRGSGKTLELSGLEKKPTLKLMQKDTEEVVQYLLKRFKKDQLYLVGHSWGTVLGFHMAQRHPELLKAFVVISPPVDSYKSSTIALKTLKKHFEKVGNKKALAQLSTVEVPAKNLKQSIIQYRWQTEYDGEKVTDEQVEQAMPFFKEWEKNWSPLTKEVFEINLFEQAPSLSCPIYFFVGRKDYQTNFSITERYYKKLKAQKKAIFWFDDAAHNVPSSNPELMQDLLINSILPETF
ncbi:MAG: alpha/beta hydrolase [Bacteroidota bacterium]